MSTAEAVEYWSADTYNAEHWAECTITTADDGGPAVRCSASGCYYFTGTSGASKNCAVWRYKTGGNWLQIGSSFSVTFTSSTVIRLEATGTTTTTLKVYADGTLKATVTDSSSPLTSGSAGLHAAGTSVLDNFNSDNVTVAAGQPTALRRFGTPTKPQRDRPGGWN